MSEPTKTDPPEWAISYVRGAMRIGMRVPAIEQYLISNGMAPDAAKRLVLEMVESAFVETADTPYSSEWGKPIRLFLSTAVAAACVFLTYWYGGQPSVGRALLFVVPALLGTYAPEIPNLEGAGWAAMSRFSGWVILLLYLALRIFILVMWP